MFAAAKTFKSIESAMIELGALFESGLGNPDYATIEADNKTVVVRTKVQTMMSPFMILRYLVDAKMAETRVISGPTIR